MDIWLSAKHYNYPMLLPTGSGGGQQLVETDCLYALHFGSCMKQDAGLSGPLLVWLAMHVGNELPYAEAVHLAVPAAGESSCLTALAYVAFWDQLDGHCMKQSAGLDGRLGISDVLRSSE